MLEKGDKGKWPGLEGALTLSSLLKGKSWPAHHTSQAGNGDNIFRSTNSGDRRRCRKARMALLSLLDVYWGQKYLLGCHRRRGNWEFWEHHGVCPRIGVGGMCKWTRDRYWLQVGGYLDQNPMVGQGEGKQLSQVYFNSAMGSGSVNSTWAK